MRRLLTSVLLSLGLMMPLTTVAQQKATPELERLRADMYRLYSTDSLERFMDVTVRLKEAALKAGDERTFYRAWANQALYIFRKKNRKEGHPRTATGVCPAARQQVRHLLRHVGQHQLPEHAQDGR